MGVMAGPTYTVADLGVFPGGSLSAATAINSDGWVIGHADVEGMLHGFVYASQKVWLLGLSEPGMVQLGTLGGRLSFATGIDNVGRAVGYSETDTGAIHAFFWPRGGQLRDLGTLGGPNSSASAIVATPRDGYKAHVIGWSQTGDGAIHAFQWDEGSPMQDLGPLGGRNAAANGMSASRHIVGEAEMSSGVRRAVLSTGVSVHDLGTLGGEESIAEAVNNAGQVVGMADTGTAIHAFLYSGGTMKDLGTLGSQNSVAHAINAAGQVVGTDYDASGRSRGFLFNGSMVDLNDLIPNDSGWELLTADGVNDAGQIVGSGIHNGAPRAFLLSPDRT